MVEEWKKKIGDEAWKIRVELGRRLARLDNMPASYDAERHELIALLAELDSYDFMEGDDED